MTPATDRDEQANDCLLTRVMAADIAEMHNCSPREALNQARAKLAGAAFEAQEYRRLSAQVEAGTPTEPRPCPFCGQQPEVRPTDPATEGNAWGEVCCINPACPTQPSVGDGRDINDDRGTRAYQAMAIQRWNRRAL